MRSSEASGSPEEKDFTQNALSRSEELKGKVGDLQKNIDGFPDSLKGPISSELKRSLEALNETRNKTKELAQQEGELPSKEKEYIDRELQKLSIRIQKIERIQGKESPKPVHK